MAIGKEKIIMADGILDAEFLFNDIDQNKLREFGLLFAEIMHEAKTQQILFGSRYPEYILFWMLYAEAWNSE